LLSLRAAGVATNTALTSANATSAATAQAARLCAMAMDRYPAYWPETIRALLTHTADWTPAMSAEVRSTKAKRERLPLLRRFGWGVPSERSILSSALNAVTLVTQDEFVPFRGEKYSMRSFRLHELPWPREVLEHLGATDIRLRITLSYYIEPSPSRRGWRRRYTYASHGLRFDLQRPLESQSEFVSRVNHEAQIDEDGSSRRVSSDDRPWLIGPQGRHVGSLHQDEWTGTGAQLARCNSVAVYPVGGWWKYNDRPDRRDFPIRYSLLVSLKTAEETIDLYTPIATALRMPIAVSVSTE
jgi:hypothetical protein